MSFLTIKKIARIEVRIGDINYGKHFGNDRALLVFHDARLRFLESLGFDEHNIGGSGIIMKDAHVYFKKEVFLHDVLVVDVGIEEVTKSAFNMTYHVKRESDETEVFYGNTVLVAYDYRTRLPVRVPEAFMEKIRVSNATVGL